jgi:LuxR family transcriptional activator of conjugal transfer of Ti plasmids
VGLDTIAVTTFRSAVACHGALDSALLVKGLRPGFEAVGFEYFSVMEAIAERGQAGLRPLVGNVNESWQRFYREHQLDRTDLRIRRARISARSFYCSEILRDDPDVSIDERKFWSKAADFGLNDSYVFPYRTAGGRVFAAVLIGEGRPLNLSARPFDCRRKTRSGIVAR